jgi:anion-transporting  ArsA/GET3 family ATPase
MSKHPDSFATAAFLATIPDTQLLVVTGKGGVGKTAVATALATASARKGKRTLLTIYERDDLKHPLLDAQVGYDPVEVQPNLWLSRLDARLSMKEYLHRNIPLHMLYDWILNGKMLGQFTDAAPGFDEIMSLGKLYDLAEGSDGKNQFDNIVFDAPATGHCALMLRTPNVLADAIRSGPLHSSALKVQGLLSDHTRCAVLVVALAEEMAIQEGSELLDYVGGELALHTGPMIINRTRQRRFLDQEIKQLQARRKGADAEMLAVIDSAIAHHRQSSLQAGYMQDLGRKQVPIIEVPQVIQNRFDAAGVIDGMAATLAPVMEGLQA